MQTIAIRDAVLSDFDAICALNLADVQHTSQMDVARLSELDSISSYHKVACIDGSVVAFILAMRHDSPYKNDNFAWFSRALSSFMYIDRIVVAQHARGLRLGSLLYDDIFRFARISGILTITCEYNIEPPNEPSRLFHDRFGFREIGRHWVSGRTKLVSLQSAET